MVWKMYLVSNMAISGGSSSIMLKLALLHVVLDTHEKEFG